jgi:hypothetical protein
MKTVSFVGCPDFTNRACLDFSDRWGKTFRQLSWIFFYSTKGVNLSARVFGAGRAKWEAILPYCEHFAMSWGKRTGDKIEKGCLDFYWENDV